MGRPYSLPANITCATRRLTSAVLYLSISSLRVGTSAILGSLLAALSQVTIKVLFMPCDKGLTAEMACDDHTAANNLTFFHCQIDGITALIANDQIEFGSKGLLKNLCQQVSAIGGTCCATPKGLARFQDIVERFVGASARTKT